MSSPDEILEKFKIAIEEINLTSKNFSLVTLIRESKSSKIYKGILSEAWQYRTVAIKRMSVDKEQLSSMIRQELLVALTLNQENIIPFFGYSQKDEKDLILVTEYAENGSLDQFLRDPDRRPTWEERLKICIGAARGLQHLHDGLQDERRVIHRNFKTANILLDKNLNAKICGFDFSMAVDPTEPKVDHAVGTLSYLDPVYYESGIVNTELDVYSFGAVLFEMLAGMLVYNGNNIDDVHPQTLINLDRNDGLDKLIDSSVRINLNMLSFKVFREIAYKCMSLKLDERPTMKMIAMRLGEALYIQVNLFI